MTKHIREFYPKCLRPSDQMTEHVKEFFPDKLLINQVHMLVTKLKKGINRQFVNTAIKTKIELTERISYTSGRLTILLTTE